MITLETGQSQSRSLPFSQLVGLTKDVFNIWYTIVHHFLCRIHKISYYHCRIMKKSTMYVLCVFCCAISCYVCVVLCCVVLCCVVLCCVVLCCVVLCCVYKLCIYLCLKISMYIQVTFNVFQ